MLTFRRSAHSTRKKLFDLGADLWDAV